jgi:hypothetical protein
MFKFLKKLFGPHICEFKCEGYYDHFGQGSDIKESLDNPDHYFYPHASRRFHWLKQGFDKARVFKSGWRCSCGKYQIFFFLANPYKKSNVGEYIIPANLKISEAEYNQMKNCNPVELGASRGKNINEVINELLKNL